MSGQLVFAYCCPGETQGISRAVHLGRLASFYPACRECPHAAETLSLSPRRVRQLEAVQQRPRAGSLFHAEGMAGSFLNELGPAEVRRVAAALAAVLGREKETEKAPETVVACDERPIAAEIGAAASEGLRQSGCTVVDAGFTTAAGVAEAIGRFQCAGGMYIGRGDRGASDIHISFFGAHAISLSAGGTLDELASLWHQGIEPCSRRAGTIRRVNIDAAVASELAPHFHGLRPLRLVLDTTSGPLARQLARLAGRAALEITPAGTASLPERVRQIGAHFGVWIDGDGVACRLVDERGDDVPAVRLTILLLRYFHEQSPGCSLIVEEPALRAVRAALGPDASLHAVPAMREGMARAMLAHAAAAGGGQSGLFWHNGPAPVATALPTLVTLLTIFSRSDAGVSAVCNSH